MSRTRSSKSAARPFVTPRSDSRTSSPTTNSFGSALHLVPQRLRQRLEVAHAGHRATPSPGASRSRTRVRGHRTGRAWRSRGRIRRRRRATPRPRRRCASSPRRRASIRSRSEDPAHASGDLLVGPVAELHRALGGVVAEEAIGAAFEECGPAPARAPGRRPPSQRRPPPRRPFHPRPRPPSRTRPLVPRANPLSTAPARASPRTRCSRRRRSPAAPRVQQRFIVSCSTP